MPATQSTSDGKVVPESDHRLSKAPLLGELLSDPALSRGIEWDVNGLTAKGIISLVTARPKLGKSTFVALYVHAKASGGRFLGCHLEQEPVLVVAPDESRQMVVQRFAALGTPHDMVRIWNDYQPTMSEIGDAVSACGAGLVVVDTLSRIAAPEVPNENDNAQWVRFFSKYDSLIRDSEAVWLFTHHDRKQGGDKGQGIRGASAIFGAVDIAFSLRPHEKLPRARLVRVEGTRFIDLPDFVIQISESQDQYLRIGSDRAAKLSADREVRLLLAQVGLESSTVNNIAIRARVNRGNAYRKLGLAAEHGLIEAVTGSRGLEYRALSTVHPNRGVDSGTIASAHLSKQADGQLDNVG